MSLWLVGDWPKALVYITLIVCVTTFLIGYVRKGI
jgi:hypothetical protein